MTLDDFFSRWKTRRDDYTHLRAQIDAANVIDQLLADLELVTQDQRVALLTLTQAAHLCGYSAEHLGRLVRTGELTNYGRLHAPRVRSGDLPSRARRSIGAPSKYDPVTDAWALRNPQSQVESDGAVGTSISSKPHVLTAKDAARYLGLAPQTLAKMRLDGSSPPYFKVGRRVLYSPEELDAWLALRRRRSTSDQGDA